MKSYRTKATRASGTGYSEVYSEARTIYTQIKKRTKRRPYVRSAYFNKDKILVNMFWQHLHQKNWRDRSRRVRYFRAAIELIRHSRIPPLSFQNPNDRNQILHRFSGRTGDNHLFSVQIKENKRSGNKWLISAFPTKSKE